MLFFGITAHPPGGSEEFRAFGVAALECVTKPQEHPDFDNLLNFLITSRHKDMTTDYQAQVLRIGFQYVLRKIEPTYPAGGRLPEQWHEWFNAVYKHPYVRGALEDAIGLNHNQANDPKRYAGPKLAILAHESKLPITKNIVDSGCSAGLGQVQMSENLPFSRIKFSGVPDYARFLLHHVLKRPLSIGKNVGFDRTIDGDVDWIESCSFYPAEYYDAAKIAQRKSIYQKREELYKSHDNFALVYGDITEGPANVGLTEVRKHVPHGKYNVSMAVTSLYEIPAADSNKAVSNLESLATDLTIVQDVAEIDADNPTKLVFATDIYAPTAHYNLFSKDVSKPDQPFEHLGRWNNFRCHSFTPSKLLIDKLLRQV